ncbi:11839_t:CDS:2 [Rhizophagus irregularis]|nr:11839_t:CDS:2 [Rhizophagus irregularis]
MEIGRIQLANGEITKGSSHIGYLNCLRRISCSSLGSISGILTHTHERNGEYPSDKTINGESPLLWRCAEDDNQIATKKGGLCLSEKIHQWLRQKDMNGMTVSLLCPHCGHPECLLRFNTPKKRMKLLDLHPLHIYIRE